jgi:hypothetical protein
MKKTKKILIIGILASLILITGLPIIKNQKRTFVYSAAKVDITNKQDLEKLRNEFGTDLIYGRFQNDQISKYLPNLKFFAKNKTRTISRINHLFNSDGTVFSYYPEENEPVQRNGNLRRYYHNQELSDFLVAHKLVINNENDAIEIAVLFDTLKVHFGYPNGRTVVVKNRISTFQVLKNIVLGNWHYCAEETETGWQAGRRFQRGVLPVSIARPIIYDFELDGQNQIVNYFTTFW